MSERMILEMPENRTAVMVAKQIFFLTERAQRQTEIAKSSPSRIVEIRRQWEQDIYQLCVSAFSEQDRVIAEYHRLAIEKAKRTVTPMDVDVP